MTTTLTAPATRPPTLDFDARLAATSAVMDERLAVAGLAVAVNTAHIDIEPAPVIDAPPIIAIPTAPCPYRTPVAAALWQTRQILEQRGWCRGHLFGEQGAVCLMGAVEVAAPGGSRLYRDAIDTLLEAIRRDFDTPSIAHWNDRLNDPFLAYRYLDQATELAHNRNH